MKKESSKDMKLIISDHTETDFKTEHKESVDRNYQSDPIKMDLYSKLLAFRRSQRKFNVQDLIKDNLK